MEILAKMNIDLLLYTLKVSLESIRSIDEGMKLAGLFEIIYNSKRDSHSPRFRSKRIWSWILAPLHIKPMVVDLNRYISTYSGLFELAYDDFSLYKYYRCWRYYRIIIKSSEILFKDNKNNTSVIERPLFCIFSNDYFCIIRADSISLFRDTPWNQNTAVAVIPYQCDVNVESVELVQSTLGLLLFITKTKALYRYHIDIKNACLIEVQMKGDIRHGSCGYLNVYQEIVAYDSSFRRKLKTATKLVQYDPTGIVGIDTITDAFSSLTTYVDPINDKELWSIDERLSTIDFICFNRNNIIDAVTGRVLIAERYFTKCPPGHVIVRDAVDTELSGILTVTKKEDDTGYYVWFDLSEVDDYRTKMIDHRQMLL